MNNLLGKDATNMNERSELKAILELIKAETKSKNQRLFDKVLKRFSKSSGDSYAIDIKAFLKKLMDRAKRQNLWRRFPCVGKSIISLCIQLPIKFKSELLIRILIKILKDLLYLLSPIYHFWIKGVELAYKMSELAYKWGNKEALMWMYDDNYIICVGMSNFIII